MKKNTIISGAVALSIGGLMAKVFSALYRILLTRVLGGEGIGLYQLIFPLYSLCVVIATAGLPMAISKVIAKNKGSERVVLKKCIAFTSLVSLILTFVLLVLSKGLAEIQGYADLSVCYVILAPSLIVLGFSSVLRGYFQGIGKFSPSAISSIIEQLIKLVAGLALSVLFLRWGLIASIVGAIVGVVVSELLSFLVLLLFFKKYRNKTFQDKQLSYKEILKDVLPITITNIILPLASFVDSVIVVNLLKVSFSQEVSVFLYGIESGAVASLVGIPTIFSFALASTILPSLAGTDNNAKRKLGLTIQLVLIISVPCALAFMFVPERLIELLYSTRLNGLGVNGLSVASSLLVVSGIGIVFLSLNQILSSSLQGINQRSVTIRNLLIAVAIKFFIETLFLASKKLNINILAFANTMCYFTIFILNYIEINIHFKFKLNYVFGGKLIAINCGMLLFLLKFLSLNKSPMFTVISIIFAIIIYFSSLIIFNIFEAKKEHKCKCVKILTNKIKKY